MRDYIGTYVENMGLQVMGCDYSGAHIEAMGCSSGHVTPMETMVCRSWQIS